MAKTTPQDIAELITSLRITDPSMQAGWRQSAETLLTGRSTSLLEPFRNLYRIGTGQMSPDEWHADPGIAHGLHVLLSPLQEANERKSGDNRYKAAQQFIDEQLVKAKLPHHRPAKNLNAKYADHGKDEAMQRQKNYLEWHAAPQIGTLRILYAPYIEQLTAPYKNIAPEVNFWNAHDYMLQDTLRNIEPKAGGKANIRQTLRFGLLRLRSKESPHKTIPLPEENTPQPSISADTIFTQMNDSDSGQLVRFVLSHINPDHAQSLWMHEVEGKKISDISDELGIPEGTIKSYLSRGRAAMQTFIKETGCATVDDLEEYIQKQQGVNSREEPQSWQQAISNRAPSSRRSIR